MHAVGNEQILFYYCNVFYTAVFLPLSRDYRQLFTITAGVP